MKKLIETLKLGTALKNKQSRKKVYAYIWDAYYQKMYYYIGTIFGVSSQKEDVVQDIMIKVYKSLDRYNITYSFNTWIFSIARNHCIDLFRKKRIACEAYEDETADNTGNSPEDQLLDSEIKAEIRRGLDSLKQEEQELCFLYFYENFKYRQISKITGLPAGTIKFRMSVIRKKLRKQLEEYAGEIK